MRNGDNEMKKLDLFYYTFENGKQVVSMKRLSFVRLYNLTKKNGKLIKVTK